MARNQTNVGTDAERQMRRLFVLERRKPGASLRQIESLWNEYAQKNGFQTVTYETIRKDLKASLRELKKEEEKEAAELRSLEAARLDALQIQFWPQAMGRFDKETNQWVEKPNVSSGWLVLAILKRRAELLGLDVPQTHIHSGKDGKPIEVITKVYAGFDLDKV